MSYQLPDYPKGNPPRPTVEMKSGMDKFLLILIFLAFLAPFALVAFFGLASP